MIDGKGANMCTLFKTPCTKGDNVMVTYLAKKVIKTLPPPPPEQTALSNE